MARANPVCAIIARRLAWALVRMASVTTIASVVFSTGEAAAAPLRRIASISGVKEGGNPRPPYSPSTSNGAAQNHGPSPTVTLPMALTTASAATLTPPGVLDDAEPRPPFRLLVVAPRPAPTLPSVKDVLAAAAAA